MNTLGHLLLHSKKVRLQGNPKSDVSRLKDIRGILTVDSHFQVTLPRQQRWTPPLATQERARFLESGPRHVFFFFFIFAHVIGDKRYHAAVF